MNDSTWFKDRVLFGAAFYEEYQPSERLEEDVRQMKNAGFSVVRVGEGSWSHWEPEDGMFSLDWLEPILDELHGAGVSAIVGLPTFAIPMWMARKYPEVAMADRDGRRRPFGGREEHSLSHPVFRYYASRVTRAIVERYADHPAVIGWQLHNEPGLHLNYSPDEFEGFKDWLRRRYGSVERLNAQWGLTYWSHELSTWDDLWEPNDNRQPQYDIEWRRYQAGLTDELLAWQRREIDALRRPEQFVTVNYALGRAALDEARSVKHVNVPGVDLYFTMQDALLMHAPSTETPAISSFGPWGLSLKADRSYGLKHEPFQVLETDGGPIGGAADNIPGYDGQWRQAAWQFIARGASLIEYWHWQQLHYGTETYWGGILPHDRIPGRVYEQISALGRELHELGDAVSGLRPDCDMALLYSPESRWALEYEPHTSVDATDAHVARNPRSYDSIVEAFYRGAFMAGLQVDVVYDAQLEQGERFEDAAAFAKRRPVLVCAGQYVASDALLQWLRDYVNAGGCLVLGPRSLYADPLARARTEVKPSGLCDLSGVTYQEFSNLSHPLPVGPVDREAELPDDAAMVDWIDCLRVNDTEGAETIMRSDHPFFGRFPMVTLSRHGRGGVWTVAGVPNEALASSVFGMIRDRSLSDSPSRRWIGLGKSVSHCSGVNQHGDRLHFLFNWGWNHAECDLPLPCERLDGDVRASSGHVHLGSWDVAVLREV